MEPTALDSSNRGTTTLNADPVSLAPLAAVSNDTLTERVYRSLREHLMSGGMAPGERLTLKRAADMLGVSQMPVREATRQLAAERALEILPNKGVRVPVMSRSRFLELRDIRLAIEGMAVELAAQTLDRRQLAAIDRLNREFASEARLASPDITRVIALNKAFHFSCYEAAGRPVLFEFIESLWLQVGPVLNLDLRAGSRRLSEAPAVPAHAALVAALRANDGPLARAALTQDIDTAAQMILSGGGLKD